MGENPERLRHWYEQTKNPLYVWQAIADAPAIPDWCMPYLREAGIKLTALAASVRARRKDPSANRAMRSVTQALLLSRQGKNMFATLANDRLQMEFAKQFNVLEFSSRTHEELDRSGQWFGPYEPPFDFRAFVWGSIERELNVARDRAQRIISYGKKLLRR